MFKKTKSLKNEISIDGIAIEVVQKRMRSLRLMIRHPNAETRISAPLRLSLKQIEEYVKTKIDWIKKQRAKILSRKKVAVKKFIEGEEHEFLGEVVFLKIIQGKKNQVKINGSSLEMELKDNSTLEQKRKLLENFFRSELKKIIPTYISGLEKRMNVRVLEFGIKKMKTRWGTCNPRAKRIWINLELAKKPLKCLEFIITHEMVHLLERKHNKIFHAHMDRFMPDWRDHQKQLKQLSID